MEKKADVHTGISARLTIHPFSSTPRIFNTRSQDPYTHSCLSEAHNVVRRKMTKIMSFIAAPVQCEARYSILSTEEDLERFRARYVELDRKVQKAATAHTIYTRAATLIRERQASG